MTPTPPDKDELERILLNLYLGKGFLDNFSPDIQEKLTAKHFTDVPALIETKQAINRLIAKERLSELKQLREDYTLDMDYEPIDKRISELEQSLKKQRNTSGRNK